MSGWLRSLRAGHAGCRRVDHVYIFVLTTCTRGRCTAAVAA